jgi:hypothetical protein
MVSIKIISLWSAKSERDPILDGGKRENYIFFHIYLSMQNASPPPPPTPLRAKTNWKCVFLYLYIVKRGVESVYVTHPEY